MNEQTSTLIRMRDVGFALQNAKAFGRSLSRIQLQKYIYLMDAISVIFDLLPPLQTHYTFRHGPFDPNIQNAVDALAFRGLASINRLVRRTDGALASEYELSDAGVRWAAKLASEKDLNGKAQISEIVGMHVDRLGWNRLVELVYAEPTFVGVRPDGYGKRLKPQRSLTASSGQLLQLIRHALTSRKLPPDGDVVVAYYFEYLDKYSIAHRNVIKDHDEI